MPRLISVVVFGALLAVVLALPVRVWGQLSVLKLTNDDSLAGEFVSSDDPAIFRWQANGFVSPFEFPISRLQSIDFLPSAPPQKSGDDWLVELQNGDVFTGNLTGGTAEELLLDSSRFGPLRVRTAAISKLIQQRDNPSLVFSGLSGLSDWTTNGSWREEGLHIGTNADQSVLTRDLQIPDRAIIEFEISWEGKPDFTFAIGVNPKTNVDKRFQGWRFETWTKVLAVVRERADSAAVDRSVSLEGGAQRVQLIAFLDQTAGRLEVFLPDGTPAGKVELPPAHPLKMTEDARRSRSGVRLVNRHGTVWLEQLRVRRWTGEKPTLLGEQPQWELASGEQLEGTIASYDSGAQRFTVRVGEQERQFPLQDLLSVSFPAQAAKEAAPAVVVLQDGSRVSGSLSFQHPGKVAVQSRDVSGSILVPREQLRFIHMQSAARDAFPTIPHGARMGKFKSGNRIMHGWLVATDGEQSAIQWQPILSRTASGLSSDISGRVIYRDPPAPPPSPPSPSVGQVDPAFGFVQPQQKVAPPKPNFRELFLKRVDNPGSMANTLGQTLHLRSGDTIPCRLLAADEEGITVSTGGSERQQIPHKLIKALELTDGSVDGNEDELKKMRLLTVPRSQRASPPTHLVRSRNGDLLRCRLISIQQGQLRIELHLKEVDLPLARAAQIIWFHPEDLSAEGGASASPETPETLPPSIPPRRDAASPLVQLIDVRDRRFTIRLRSLAAGIIAGESEVVGPCRIPLENVNQILIGGEIQAAATGLAFNSWRLKSAVEPLFNQEGADVDSGGDSVMVGKAAPDFELDLLNGGRFRLSKEKGRIIVLDFWATWCGPCMHSMPLVQQALSEFPSTDVRLISVNLEEPAEHVRGVMERHDLTSEVVLDIDGVAARRYEANAIPQLVVIDREGVIAKVYVGGGAQVIEELKRTLQGLTAEQPAQP